MDADVAAEGIGDGRQDEIDTEAAAFVDDADFVVWDVIDQFGVGIHEHAFKHAGHVGRFFENP